MMVSILQPMPLGFMKNNWVFDPRKLPVQIIATTRQLGTFLSGNCLTTGGAKPDKKCMFPFTYKGVTHKACTDHGNEDPEWLPWCSTKVDDYGGHVGGNWGDCSEECPFELSKHTIYSIRHPH